MLPTSWKLSDKRSSQDDLNYYRNLVSKYYCGGFDLGYLIQEIGVEEVEKVLELVRRDGR